MRRPCCCYAEEVTRGLSRRKKHVTALGCLAVLLTLTACKSAYVAATVSNRTGAPVSLIEVDYPSASFGRESLAANATFPYRFKILGSGPTKVSWTDAAHHDHTSAGPDLHEGQQGRMLIVLTPASATWSASLTP
jgi:hypothetical protein